MQIGMIGLGRMGANMVERLMLDGHDCVVFDPNKDAVDALVAAGIPVLVGGEAASGGKTSDAKLAFLDPTVSRTQAFEFLSKIAIVFAVSEKS